MKATIPEAGPWAPALDSVWATLPYTDPTDGAVPAVSGDLRRLAAVPSGLAVDEFAVAAVSAVLRAGSLLGSARTGARSPVASLSAAHVADAFRSEMFVSVPGQERVSGFAPLSRFWLTGDGWLRTHANYPWHLAALLAATGSPAGAEPDAVAAALMADSALHWEDRIVAAGGVAAAVRTPQAWAAAAPGQAVGSGPLVHAERIGDARPGPVLDRMRVLDLTRVIAGPVAGRTLGSFGADVLRLDPPDRPELDFQRIDGLLGKRSALLDVHSAAGRRTFDGLLRSADVLLYGYRPGASALDPVSLAERYPGLVIVQLSAWGQEGPWRQRRGFDSLVQAASGIAHLQAGADGRPGALPCQALDHATGYLMAASALLGLRARSRTGGSHLIRLSLAAAARQLLALPRADLRELDKKPANVEDWTTGLPSADGTGISVVAPPGAYEGVPLRWPEPLSGYGSSEPTWLP